VAGGGDDHCGIDRGVGGLLGTLGRDARKQSSFVWWIANRLMFLAAVTSLQGSVFYFVMYAFKLSAEARASLAGTLTTVIGVSSCLRRWRAAGFRIGSGATAGVVSGSVAAVGNVYC